MTFPVAGKATEMSFALKKENNKSRNGRVAKWYIL
jgi:hypothetical protein